MVEYVDKLDILGIYFCCESCCYYFIGEVLVQLIGVIDVDDMGVEGLECMYNEWLMGMLGFCKICCDVKGCQVEILEIKFGEKVGDLQLIIDQCI